MTAGTLSTSLEEYLWNILDSSLFNIEEYRNKIKEQFSLNDEDMRKYLPHPVKIKVGEDKYIYGLIAIHPDFGEKPSTDIRVMTFKKAVNDNFIGRESYLKEYLLGGVHGINVRDIISGLDNDMNIISKYLPDFKNGLILKIGMF